MLIKCIVDLSKILSKETDTQDDNSLLIEILITLTHQHFRQLIYLLI